jgi:CheY-like chemotaxis protein/HPt (histidine-containing phosphotransfer) domain-containing protein
VDPQVPSLLQGDPGRLRQVLTNLATNAIKFTPKGKVAIMVSLVENRDDDVTLQFEVKDTGIGIPSDRMDRLFKSFSQVDASTTRRFGGTGLGLAISKKLTEMMGGQIGVESTEGRGTTFWFSAVFRRRRISDDFSSQIQPPPLVTRHTIEETRRRAIRILLVEDNEINQKVAIKMLGDLGYSAIPAANGKVALAVLEHTVFDLILMDIQMPEMDGYEATERIRSSSTTPNNRVPIIAMTANAMKGDREACLKVGMNDYIAKPINAKQLLEKLDKWAPRKKSWPQSYACRQIDHPASEVTGSSCPMAVQTALNRTMGDRRFLKKTVDIFLTQLPDHLSAIEKALNLEDAEKVSFRAHALKGAAANLSMDPLAGVARQLEFIARDGILSQGTSLVAQLQDEARRLTEYIQSLEW